MKSYDQMEYFDKAESLVDVICQKTQNPNRHFFRIHVAYYLSKISSMMRVNVVSNERGKVPTNMYAINLMPSGEGKGYSTNILEEQVTHLFNNRFIEETVPYRAEENLVKLANKRAAKKSEDPDDELLKVEKEYKSAGEMLTSFDAATTAAIKQYRQKLLMSGVGAMNLEMDELGSNLLSNQDVLGTFLELYDVGKVKQKLTKNTNENIRTTEIHGRTPANLMLFGTPDKLLDGSKVEEEFISFAETGYGRRCWFGYASTNSHSLDLTPEEVYDMLTDKSSNAVIEDMADYLYGLADISFLDTEIIMPKEGSLLLIEYRQQCERKAAKLPNHENIIKAEMSHRYFKATKLAGTYAFIDGSAEVEKEHIYAAIKLAEDSGENFAATLSRDRAYVKVAKYISTINREITHVDLMEDLPCYKGSESARRDILTLATTWGYKNNVIIKRQFLDGIEFLHGESLQDVDLDNISVAYSNHFAFNYINESPSFAGLHKLTQLPGMHWTNHHLKGGNESPANGHRDKQNVIPGCEVIVLDVDNGVSLDTAKLLLSDYTYHIHTTKSHKKVIADKNPKGEDRFRVIMPLSHTVKLDDKDFKEFMNNIYEWLPFEVDAGTNQREKKWETFKGEYFDNEGEVLDAFSFIPKTAKSEQQKSLTQSLHNLDNLERWFVSKTGIGNRSNNLIRFALMLVDDGKTFAEIQDSLTALNNKLPEPIDDAELNTTIMRSVGSAISKRGS